MRTDTSQRFVQSTSPAIAQVMVVGWPFWFRSNRNMRPDHEHHEPMTIFDSAARMAYRGNIPPNWRRSEHRLTLRSSNDTRTCTQLVCRTKSRYLCMNALATATQDIPGAVVFRESAPAQILRSGVSNTTQHTAYSQNKRMRLHSKLWFVSSGQDCALHSPVDLNDARTEP